MPDMMGRQDRDALVKTMGRPGQERMVWNDAWKDLIEDDLYYSKTYQSVLNKRRGVFSLILRMKGVE